MDGNTPKGFFVDLAKDWALASGYELSFVYGEFPDLLEKIKNNEIDSGKLAERAFQNSKNWRKLVSSTHPYITKRIRRIIENTKYKYYAIDAPLLFEANMNGICNFIIYIEAPYQTRVKRLEGR